MADKRTLAIAIEDQVDVRLGDDAPISMEIPEGQDYLEEAKSSLRDIFEKIAASYGDARAVFSNIGQTVVSTPGVVRDRRTLLQVTLWHSSEPEILRSGKGFDFADALGSIIEEIILRNGQKWPEKERAEFENNVTVVNDAIASAAYEFRTRWREAGGRNKRPEQIRAIANFAYIKIHDGINVGVVEADVEGNVVLLRVKHGEAGHTYPIPHLADRRFPGVCPYHSNCYEGMICGHSFVARARQGSSDGPLGQWKAHLDTLGADVKDSTFEDTALVNWLLPDSEEKQDSLAVEIISHYVEQLVAELAIGPWVPDRIVIGGRLSKPSVVASVGNMFLQRSNGYPRFDDLSRENIGRYIIRTSVPSRDKPLVELYGAAEIARGRAKANGKDRVLQEWKP